MSPGNVIQGRRTNSENATEIFPKAAHRRRLTAVGDVAVRSNQVEAFGRGPLAAVQRTLFLNGDRPTSCPSIKNDNFCRFITVVLSVMPFIDELDDGIPGFEM